MRGGHPYCSQIAIATIVHKSQMEIGICGNDGICEQLGFVNNQDL